MRTLAHWCFRHRYVVIALWLLAIVGFAALLQRADSAYTNTLSLPGAGSTEAHDLLDEGLPAEAGAIDSVVWHTDEGTVRDPAVRQRMSATLDTIAELPSVANVVSPYQPDGSGQISADGRTAYAQIGYDALAQELEKERVESVVDTARDAGTDGLRVEVGGPAVLQTEDAPPMTSELIGIAAAAIVLFVAFGSLFAMVLPIVTAVAALGVATSAMGLLSHTMDMPELSPLLGALVGLGVGLDYALFIVTRHRAGVKSGLDVEESAIRSINTSGRAVVFAGCAVTISLLGMLVLGVNYLNGLAVSAALTVVVTVLASITLLPAMLGVLGPRVLSRRERHAKSKTSGRWVRLAHAVERRPRVLSLGAIGVMLVLAIPLLSMRLGSSDAGNNPTSTTTRQAYDMLADGFGPGFNGPLQVVTRVTSPGDVRALDRLADELRATDGVADARVVPTEPDAAVGLIQVTPTTSPEAKATSELIEHVRRDVVPASGLNAYIGGQTAVYDDFADLMRDKLPLFIGVIVGLGCLLLLVAFRSVLVALLAAAMNLLAAAASFGVVIAVFQWGWGADLLDVGGAGPVESYLPVVMIAILFGLSMDYQVFLVSRMHEEWVHTRDNRQAVIVGQTVTARVITAAATIMICVFVAFVFTGARPVAEFGIGLSSAVALDAFVLRTFLVPALMHLLGNANWWLPSWLDRRLPRLSVEPADEQRPDRELVPIA